MITAFDHLVIVVPNLAEAIERFAALGFDVRPGGRHSTGTHNALIALADGSYLELLAFETPNPKHRWAKILGRGGGFADICLVSDDLPDDQRRFSAAGITLGEPFAMSRTRPDGRELKWRLSIPQPPFGEVVPFLIEDITARSDRVPPASNHHNGVVGIDTVSLLGENLAEARQRFGTIFGQPGEPISGMGGTTEGVRFMIGNTALDVIVRPPDSQSACEAPMPGPFSIALAVSSRLPAVRTRLETCGVRLEYRPAH